MAAVLILVLKLCLMLDKLHACWRVSMLVAWLLCEAPVELFAIPADVVVAEDDDLGTEAVVAEIGLISSDADVIT